MLITCNSNTKLLLFIFYFPLQLRKITTQSNKRDAASALPEEQDNTLPRRHSQKDIKSSLSTLSFSGHESFGGEKRHSLRSNSSVMGKIKDRTGIAV